MSKIKQFYKAIKNLEIPTAPYSFKITVKTDEGNHIQEGSTKRGRKRYGNHTDEDIINYLCDRFASMTRGVHGIKKILVKLK